MGKKHPNVTNLLEVEKRQLSKGSRFGFTSRRLGPAAGAMQLGIGWFEVEPGRQAFPFHYHCANEEGLYILEGTGEMRIGEARVPVEPGDFIAFPIGPESAHSLTNNGQTPLRYLCFSTMHATEICGYPDSKKLSAIGSTDISKGILASQAWVRLVVKEQPPVDYYDGEKVD